MGFPCLPSTCALPPGLSGRGKGSLASGVHVPRDSLHPSLCQELLCPEGPFLALLPSPLAALSLSLLLCKVGGTEVRGKALGPSAWVLSLAPARQGTPGRGRPSAAPVRSRVGLVTMSGALGSESRSGPVTRNCSSGNATAATVKLLRGPRRGSPAPTRHEERPRLAPACCSPA